MLCDGVHFLSITRAGAKARCSMTSLRCSMTRKPICRRSCGRNCSICILTGWAIDRHGDAEKKAETRTTFMHHYYAYVYVRIMQALGAYGFRGFYERKTHFLQSVPYALRNIRWLLHNVELPVALPTLTEAFKAMVGVGEIAGSDASREQADCALFRAFHFIAAFRWTRLGMVAASFLMPAAFRIPAAKNASSR